MRRTRERKRKRPWGQLAGALNRLQFVCEEIETCVAKTITGKDALSVSVKVDTTSIKEFLELCYEQYLSKEYKKGFDWIDQISEVRNALTIEKLDTLLLKKIEDEDFAKVWMAVPEVVDWVDIRGFRYLKRKEAELVDDLDIKAFVAAAEDKDVDIDFLKTARVFLISSKTDAVNEVWSAYRCIYAEIEYKGRVYILNNGKWYEIVKDFADQINKGFSQMEESTVTLIDYVHKDEAAYNTAASAAIPSSCCMDREMIQHGGGQSKIEFCDIYDAKPKRLIHVNTIPRDSACLTLRLRLSRPFPIAALFSSRSGFRSKHIDDTYDNASSARMAKPSVAKPSITCR